MSAAALTIDEIAAALDVSTWTVRKAISEGHLAKIPHTGRLVRCTPDAVEACFGIRVAAGVWSPNTQGAAK